MEQKPKMNPGNEAPDSLLKTSPECVSVPYTDLKEECQLPETLSEPQA